jgi:hypothetical protein
MLNISESSTRFGMPGPRALLFRSGILLFVNFALAAWVARPFMPSELAIGLGSAYGMLCAFYHAHVVRLARRRVEALEGAQRDSLRRSLQKPLLVFGLVHVAFGMGGFALGVASLYTNAFGHRDERTYAVFDSVWKARRLQCYKYEFSGISAIQNYFGAPCLEVEYEPGTLFHYHGQSSFLGFKRDHLEIESNRPPLHRHSRQ